MRPREGIRGQPPASAEVSPTPHLTSPEILELPTVADEGGALAPQDGRSSLCGWHSMLGCGLCPPSLSGPQLHGRPQAAEGILLAAPIGAAGSLATALQGHPGEWKACAHSRFISSPKPRQNPGALASERLWGHRSEKGWPFPRHPNLRCRFPSEKSQTHLVPLTGPGKATQHPAHSPQTLLLVGALTWPGLLWNQNPEISVSPARAPGSPPGAPLPPTLGLTCDSQFPRPQAPTLAALPNLSPESAS